MNKEKLRMSFLAGLITEGEYKQKLQEKQDLNENELVKIARDSTSYNEFKDKAFNHLLNISKSTFKTGSKPDKSTLRALKSIWDRYQKGYLDAYLDDLEEKQDLNENVVGIGAINNPFPTREKSDYELAFEHFTRGEVNEEDSMGKIGKQYAAPGQEKEVKGKKKEIKWELERQNANEFFKKTVSEIYNDASQGLIFVAPNPESPERKSVFVDEKGKYKYLLTGEKNYGVGEVPYTNSIILPKSEAVSSPNKLDSFNFHIILRAVLQSEVQGPFKLPPNGKYQVSYAPDGTYRGIENVGNLIKVGWAGYVVELSKFSRVNPDFGFPQKLGGDLAWVSYRFRD